MYLRNPTFCNSLEFCNLLKRYMPEIVREENGSLAFSQLKQRPSESQSKLVMFHKDMRVRRYSFKLLCFKQVTEAQTSHHTNETLKRVRRATVLNGLRPLSSLV